MSTAIQTLTTREKSKPPIMAFSHEYWGWTGREKTLKFLPSQIKQLHGFLKSDVDAFLGKKNVHKAVANNVPKKPLFTLRIFGPVSSISSPDFLAIFKPILRFLHSGKDLMGWVNIETPNNPELRQTILAKARDALLPEDQRRSIAREVEYMEARGVLAKVKRERAPIKQRVERLKKEVSATRKGISHAKEHIKSDTVSNETKRLARVRLRDLQTALQKKQTAQKRNQAKLDVANAEVATAQRECDALIKG